ncbi:MAG: 1-acyl-sn-glycerol-3-phosphate acyltransferase, partial [Clostridia bacterium]|nr:1-acyl-sn-glycerol-3-phosphate acyltransferase [Clostridia bacterium]
YIFLRFFCFVFSRLFLGFRCRDRYRIKKGEPVLVLSNHQTDADPLCILPSFVPPVYPVATDNIFSGKAAARLFTYISVIPKKKGTADLRTVIRMLEYLRRGTSVMLFPEGNRYYAEFQYYIAPELAKLVKRSKATLILFNLHGGSGVSPRWARRRRRGSFRGEIRRILKYDEYSLMTDDELNRVISEGIRVYDSESGEEYKSPRRAEYLEKMLFCCPVCGKFETIFSRGAEIGCRACGMKAEYGTDLRIHGLPGYERLADWWEFEKKAVREMTIKPGNTVFSDGSARLFSSVPFEKRKLLCRGPVTLTDGTLRCGKLEFEVAKITSASVISGGKLAFVYGKSDYTVVGGKRFNPVKYIFALNRLDSAMKINGTDLYFNLGEPLPCGDST